LGATPILWANGSVPHHWIEKNGAIVHGSIQPETKAALSVLADWYKKGIIPRDYATMKNGDEVRDAYVNTNGCGIIFSAWWQPWPNWNGHGEASVWNDGFYEWIPVLAPLDKNGKYSAVEDIYRPGGQVVNARCKSPEAVVKAMNVIAENMQYYAWKGDQKATDILAPMYASSDGRTCAPFVGGIAPPLNRIDAYFDILNYIETGVVSDTFAANNEVQGAYRYAKDGGLKSWYAIKNGPTAATDDQKTDAMQRYVGQYGYVLAGEQLADSDSINFVYPAFKGSTEGIIEYGAILKDLMDTTFKQIITGQKSIDAFDTYVSQWKKLGGDFITKEINAAKK
jgi:putative aldouronate transport system substrate-binding protein